jgi:uncharacterized damage-inducible protein DinB
MHTEKLLDQLLAQTRHIIDEVEKLRSLDTETLSRREHEHSWNILECIEHLNLYGDYYLPEIESKIMSSKTQSEQHFRPGILGDYFAKSMIPKEKLNKMKTFKDKNPLNQDLDISVMDKFLEQQNKLLELLEQSKGHSLNKIKISVSISRFIKLKLGDAFRFYINHMIRHMAQIRRIQNSLN